MGLRIFYIIMGGLSLANGAYMLFYAEHWYYNIPAEVPDTGPFNGHFIRDIGLAYAISGAGFIWSAIYIRRCRVVHFGNTLFVSGHALLHVIDIVVERLPLDHVLHDAAGVLIPGAIMLTLCIPVVWDKANPYDIGR